MDGQAGDARDAPVEFLRKDDVGELALAVAAPSSPGFVGVYQVGCTLGFAIFAISENTAITFAILSHVFQYIIFSVYGLHFLSKSQLKFSDLKEVLSSKEKRL